MKKSLFLLLFANAYLFSSQVVVPDEFQTLCTSICQTIGYQSTGKYLDYVSESGDLTAAGAEFLRPFVDDQNGLRPEHFNDLIHDICHMRDIIKDLQETLKTPNLLNTVQFVIKGGTKFQRAGMLFVGLFAVYGVVTACLNAKKKFFSKENNS